MTRADCNIVRVDTEHTGGYKAVDRPRRLVFTFAGPMYSPKYTRVTRDIAPDGEGRLLTLTHEGVLPGWAEGTSRAEG